MKGGPTTSGFVAKRGSASASCTTKGAGASGMIACAQKASSLRVGARLVRSVRTAQKAGHANREQPTTDSLVRYHSYYSCLPVWDTSRPTHALNHWRSTSTSVTRQMGTLNMCLQSGG